jgi:hypothetical protein
VLSQLASTLVPDTGSSCENASRAFTKKVIASAAKIATINRDGRAVLMLRHYHRIVRSAKVKSVVRLNKVCTLAASG